MMDTSSSVGFGLACVLAAGPVFAQGAVPPSPRVSGVVHEGGGAAPGVEVLLRPFPSAYRLGLHELGVPNALPDAVAEVLSDADGRFRLTAPAVGPYRLEFRFAGDGVAMPTLHCPLLPLAAPVVLGAIELPALYRLTVRAEDSAGVPLPGALVLADATTATPSTETRLRSGEAGSWFLEPGPSEPCRPQANRVTARTDEDGFAQLLVPHVRSAVLVSAPGHRRTGRTVDSDEASFRLEPDAGVKVRVRGPDGSPAPGVLVRTGGPMGLPLALTDERGEALVHLADQREARIEFEAGDHARARLVLPPGGTAGMGELDVELEPPARLNARVVDTESGEAIAGAVAWLASDPGLGAGVDQFGGLSVPVPAGAAGLGIVAAGYFPATLHLGRPETWDAAPVNIGLTPVAPLHGRVVDGLGEPVPGATVKAVPNNRGVLPNMWSTGFGSVLSAADGSFRVATAVHGRPYRLTAAAEGYGPAVLEVPAIERGGAPPPVQLVVTRGRQPWGTVTDLEGAPVEGAQVSLLRLPDFGPIEMSALAAPVADPIATSARGEFEFPNIAAGVYGLRVNHLDYLELRWQEVNVPPGEGYADLGVFTLAAGVEVHGVVTGLKGRPVGGAEVLGRQQMQILARVDRNARTDRDGRFRLAGLADAPVDIAVIAEGHAPQTVKAVRPGTGEPILIELGAGASLAGTVRREDGSPAGAVEVHLVYGDFDGFPGARPRSFETRADGTFRADNLRPGVWSVSASDDAGGKVEEKVRLVAADLREVELRFGAGDRLTVAVTNPQGQPVARAGVTVRSANAFARSSGSTDVSGRVVLSAKAGPAKVSATHSRWRKAEREVVLDPGTNELAIRLEAGFEITGQVRTVDGRPIQGAVVDAGRDYGFEADTDLRARFMFSSRLGGLTPRTFTDAAGAFRLTVVEPGTFFLSATLPGHAMRGESQKIEVAGQSVTGIVIKMVSEASIRGVVTGLGEAGTASARMAAVEVGAWRGTQLRTATPDVHGAFELDGLSPGEWRLWATCDDRRSPERTVRVASGATSELVELRFELGLRLGGQVFSEGTPYRHAQVRLRRGDDGTSRRAPTDRDGRFVFEGLSAGLHQLAVVGPTGAATEREIDLQTDVDHLILDLDPASEQP